MMTAPILTKVQALNLVRKALFKASARRELLATLWDDLDKLMRLVRAWAVGRYDAIPWRTVAMAIGALVYFVNPLDAIPDVLLGIGYLDDASVLAMVVASLRGDLEKFAQWEREEANTITIASTE